MAGAPITGDPTREKAVSAADDLPRNVRREMGLVLIFIGCRLRFMRFVDGRLFNLIYPTGIKQLKLLSAGCMGEQRRKSDLFCHEK